MKLRKPHVPALWKIVALYALLAAPLAHSIESVTQTLEIEALGIHVAGVNVAKPVSAAGSFDERGKLRDDDLSFLASLDSQRPYTIQLTSGEEIGAVARIDSFTENELITVPDLRPRVDAGDSYEIREDWTIADIFGTANEAGLSPIDDQIWVPNPDGTFLRVYWHDGRAEFPEHTAGWKFDGSGNADASQTVLPFYFGFVVHLHANQLSLTITGEERRHPVRVPVRAGKVLLNRINPNPQNLDEMRVSQQLLRGPSGDGDLIWTPNGDGTFTLIYFMDDSTFFPPFTPGLKTVGGGDLSAAGEPIASAFYYENRGPAREIVLYPGGFPTEQFERPISIVPGMNLVGLEVTPGAVVTGSFESPNTDLDVDFEELLGPSGSKDYLLRLTGWASFDTLAAVTSWTRNEISLASGAVSGNYQIFHQPAVGTIFGPNNESGLAAGGPDTGDVIWIPNGDGTYDRVYQNNVVFGFPPLSPGWRYIGGGDADASGQHIDPLEGFFIQRRAATPLSIPVTGNYITFGHSESRQTGFHPVARRQTNDLSLGQLDELTNFSLRGFRSGDENSADVLWLPNGDGTYTRVYRNSIWQTFPPKTPGWRQIGHPGDEDASGLLIPSAFVIEKRRP